MFWGVGAGDSSTMKLMISEGMTGEAAKSIRSSPKSTPGSGADGTPALWEKQSSPEPQSVPSRLCDPQLGQDDLACPSPWIAPAKVGPVDFSPSPG